LPALDLSPFGFTQTESRVYGALLELGPTTGYAVARAAGLARANAYGALDGLVHRGAATKDSGRPVRYRPADPQALVARLAAEQGEALERLSRALERAARTPEAATRSLDGSRAIANVVMQLVARAEARVSGVVSPDLLRLTLPAWRRAGERAALHVRVSGAIPPEAEPFVAGGIPEEWPTVLLIDDGQVVLATGTPPDRTGLWSSHPAVVALARVALADIS